MERDVEQETPHHCWRDLRMIANLQGHYPPKLARRAGNDVGKIAVQ